MMGEQHYTRLGLFVVVTVFLILAALFVLGGRSYLKPRFTFETYFDGSVAGLEIGAPVRFRGVPMGQVTEIVTSFDEYEADRPVGKRRTYIIVRATVDGSENRIRSLERNFAEYVRIGMRAQTALAGITGQQYLALDITDPARAPPLPFDWEPRYPYLPSAPSLTSAIFASAQEFLARLNEADLPRLSKNLSTFVATLNGKLEEAPVDQLAADSVAAIREIRGTMARINGLIEDPALRQGMENLAAASARLRALTESGELERTIRSLDLLAQRLDGVVADNQYDVRVAVRDARTAAENLRRLSEALRRNPTGTLLRPPPDPVVLPGDKE